MPNRIISGSPQHIIDVLNGAATSSDIKARELPVGGLTITFTTPAQVVTFTGALGSLKTLAEVASEIASQTSSAVLATIRAGTGAPASLGPDANGRPMPRQRLSLQRDGGLAWSGGTALAELGLPPTFTSAGAVAADKIKGPCSGPTEGQLTVIITP